MVLSLLLRDPRGPGCAVTASASPFQRWRLWHPSKISTRERPLRTSPPRRSQRTGAGVRRHVRLEMSEQRRSRWVPGAAWVQGHRCAQSEKSQSCILTEPALRSVGISLPSDVLQMEPGIVNISLFCPLGSKTVDIIGIKQ